MEQWIATNIKLIALLPLIGWIITYCIKTYQPKSDPSRQKRIRQIHKGHKHTLNMGVGSHDSH